MTEPKKTTIYVDVNDEITSIISKMQDAPARIVAFVLPKRAPTFQSIINIKLLKKASDKAKKKSVLITSDKTVLPLAGAAGLHVARTAESKPYIPDAPQAADLSEAQADEAALDPSKPIGQLAQDATDKEEAIDLGDMSKLDLDESDTPASDKKKPKRSGIKVPNFNKFRLVIILGVLGILLLGVGWYVAAFVLPRADIMIETSAQNIAETIEFDIRTDQDGVDTEGFVIPATAIEYEFEDSATAQTSGEENFGDRATGTVTVTNCETAEGESITVSEGDNLTAENGLVFRATETVEVPGSSLSGTFLNPSCDEDGNEDVDVEARGVGTDYNIDAMSYSVEGYSSETVYGSGDKMTDGTDDIVDVVAERDIRAAQDELDREVDNAAETELVELHDIDGFLPITETLTEGDENVSASPNEGEEAEEVTVTLRKTYTMLGVAPEDVRQLIEAKVGEEFDLDRQTILDDGLDEASLRVVEEHDGGTQIRMRTIVSIGPEIDKTEVKELIAGTKRTETEQTILLGEGVQDVRIDYSPFWVFSTPDDPSKIHLTVEQQGDDINEDDEGDEDETSEGQSDE